jgi:archaellum component FlaC
MALFTPEQLEQFSTLMRPIQVSMEGLQVSTNALQNSVDRIDKSFNSLHTEIDEISLDVCTMITNSMPTRSYAKALKTEHSGPKVITKVSPVESKILNKIDKRVLDQIPLDSGIIMSETFVRILERLFEEEKVQLKRMKKVVFEEFEREATYIKEARATRGNGKPVCTCAYCKEQ